MPLITESNFHQPGKRYMRAYRAGDDFYQALIDTHRDLSEEESTQVNARLILLLANHIGDLQVLRQAMRIARDGGLAPLSESDPPSAETKA